VCVFSVLLADVDAARVACGTFADNARRGGGPGAVDGGDDDHDPDTGLPAEFSGAALLGRPSLEAALSLSLLRWRAVLDGCG
jgi:hypothetical protein